jgi:hypothetical protein
MRWLVSRPLRRSAHRRSNLENNDKCSLHFGLFLTLLLTSALAFGQDASQAGNKKPRTLDDYQPRTLEEIVAMKPDPKELRDKQDRLLVTADDLPSKVLITYTGTTRLIPPFKKEAIRQWARFYAGSIEHYTVPYQSEMLFMENGVGYWLGVQKNSPLSKKELRTGAALNLYLTRVGASIVGDKYDWTLLIEDYREVETSRPAAEIEFREIRFRKPPLAELYFDVTLRNDRAAPRWFLLPSNLGSGKAPIGEKGGVDGLEAFAPKGKGHVIVGHFLGTGGFHAILLAPRSEVRLRLFPISYWGDPPANLQMEIVIARGLTIGDKRAEKWFGKNPMSSVTADILENAEDVRTMTQSRRAPEYKEVAIVIEKDRRLQLTVSLKRKE